MLTGCGGGGPSREAFARDADAICRPALAQLLTVKERIDVVAAGADPDVIFTRTAALIRRGAAISRATFDRIEGLQAPEGQRDAVNAWVAANRRQAALTDDLADAFAAQDQTRIARLSEEVDELDERTNATARGFGMRSCAERVQA